MPLLVIEIRVKERVTNLVEGPPVITAPDHSPSSSSTSTLTPTANPCPRATAAVETLLPPPPPDPVDRFRAVGDMPRAGDFDFGLAPDCLVGLAPLASLVAPFDAPLPRAISRRRFAVSVHHGMITPALRTEFRV